MALLPLKDDNPLTSIPFQYVTVGLIAVNVVVFLWQLSLGPAEPRAVLGLGVIPVVLFNVAELPPEYVIVPSWMTLITSLFLHGGWLHLLGNMLFLWIFGDNIEDAMGHVRYLIFYLVCGVVASLAHALFNFSSTSPLIGASGAISGVLGAYLILHPKARVLVLFMNIIPMRLPAVIVLLFWFGLQFVNAAADAGGAGGGTAWWAHVGGFAVGIALVFVLRRRTVPVFDGIGKFAPPDKNAAVRVERRNRRSIFPTTTRPDL
jgi:membrane associated rhomboid family serine protease